MQYGSMQYHARVKLMVQTASADGNISHSVSHSRPRHYVDTHKRYEFKFIGNKCFYRRGFRRRFTAFEYEIVRLAAADFLKLSFKE